MSEPKLKTPLEQIVEIWKEEINNKELEPKRRVIARILYDVAINTEMGTKEASTKYPVELNADPRVEEMSLYNMIDGRQGGIAVAQIAHEHFGGIVQWNPKNHRFYYQPPKPEKK